jgi:uncharacterized protein YyaL (SSP411 family)
LFFLKAISRFTLQSVIARNEAILYRDCFVPRNDRIFTSIGAKLSAMNELNLETSPYLLQHANNPIHWKAWNDKTLSLAKEQNKLIIVSIGYSACHWCHVMEHGSFENEEVATTMNSNYISIKVDREERPDVDAVYMKALQIMTGSGGWPLNIVCLPNGKPVWGGTYFKKNEWIGYLNQITEIYNNQPEKLEEYASKLDEGLAVLNIIYSNPNTEIDYNILEPLLEKWKKSFDWDYGGMARAPKFMMPNNYEFLLRYAYQNKDEKLLDFVNLTLTKMAYGGIFDTVSGGFSRYSVDIKWHIPHFEKMLYDNAQLVSLYSNSYKLTQNQLYKEIITKTLSFVENEWLTKEGGFYSALDADSLNSQNYLEEGAFYVWTKEELQKIITSEFELFSEIFNINDFGFWEHNNYVLIQNQSLETIAKNHSISINEIVEKKKNWETILHLEKQKRAKPRLDDKCLCSWNAMMLKGFVDAYKALQDKKYLEIAIKNANFITAKFWSSDGNLFHNYKNDKATINGYLEDYAFVIDSFIALYQVTLNEEWITISKQLTDYCLDNFYDEEQHFFQFTSIEDKKLITTHYEIEDNVIPASNSVIANNLYVLSIYFNNSHYEKIARKMLLCVLPNIDYPSAFSNWLNLLLQFSNDNKELAICGKDALQYSDKFNSLYKPNVVVAGTNKNSKLPFLQNRYIENQMLFYLCENKTCQLPIENFKEIISKI